MSNNSAQDIFIYDVTDRCPYINSHMKSFIQSSKFNITIINKINEGKYIKKLERIDHKVILIVPNFWHFTRVIINKNVVKILLTYFVPNSSTDSYNRKFAEFFNRCRYDYYISSSLFPQYDIFRNYIKKNTLYFGDFQIENCLKNATEEYDIVYFPNYPVNNNSMIRLQETKLMKQNRIVYNVLSKYKSKGFSIITLPHPCRFDRYFSNHLKFINPKYFSNAINYIPKAHVIINACKSFNMVAQIFDKPIIHLRESSNIDTSMFPRGFVIDELEMSEEILENDIEKCLKMKPIKNNLMNIFYDPSNEPSKRLIELCQKEFTKASSA